MNFSSFFLIRLLKKLFPRYKIVIEFYRDNNYHYLVFRRDSEFVKEIKILLIVNIPHLLSVIYTGYKVIFSGENHENSWITLNIFGLILAGLAIYKIRRKRYWEKIGKCKTKFEALEYLNFPKHLIVFEFWEN